MRERLWDLSRRDLLKLFGISVGAGILDPAVWPRNIQAQSKKVTPRRSARNLLILLLHVLRVPVRVLTDIYK